MLNSYIFVLAVVSLHIIFFCVDYLFKSCLVLPYINCLKKFGIQVGFLQITWFTTAFNRCIQKIGSYRTKYQSVWFSVGTWISLCILPFAIFFLLQSLYALFTKLMWRDQKMHGTTPFLEPIFPGINMPVSDLGYYTATLLVCTVFHELGHALAAVREGIHITGAGLIIFFVVPVCFIKLEGIDLLPAHKQLKVCCAGIWHNLVLSFTAIIVLTSIPWVLYPFYDYGTSVQVVAVNKDSPLYGIGGLKTGDIITTINRCRVTDYATWVSCIKLSIQNPVFGYCLNSEFVHDHDESIPVKMLPHGFVECCRNVSSNLCFENIEEGNEPIEIPQYSCLTVRTVLLNTHHMCYSAADCNGLFCLRPFLYNNTKLIEIQRASQDAALFLGHPVEIYREVHITEFVEKAKLSAMLPDGIRKFCEFIIMISSAFAMLNIIPCFYLDGHMITRILVNTLLAKTVKLKSVRLAIALSIIIIGSFILVLYTVLVFLSVFSN